MMSRNVTRARTKTQTLSLPAQAVRPNENRTGNWSRGKRIRPDVDETCILIDGKAIAGAPCTTPALDQTRVAATSCDEREEEPGWWKRGNDADR